MNGRGITDRLRRVDKTLSRRLSNTRKILVDARTPMNIAVVAPIVRAFRSDTRVDFYFTSSNKGGHFGNIFDELDPSASIISPGRAALSRFDAYIAADIMWAKLPRGTRRIHMFHGVAGKYADVYDRPSISMRHWDRIFFINRRRLANFIASGAIDAKDPAARLVGFPKLDRLVNGSLDRDEVVRGLGMDPSQPVILYAPTWSPYSSLNLLGEELVTLLCNAGYKVIVKLHDRAWDPDPQYSGGINWAQLLEPRLIENGGLLARGSDATPFLAAADVMITDHSSAGFEYLLVDRPLIRIEIPELISATRIPEEYVAMLAKASSSVRTAESAVKAVETCLSDPAAGSVSRRSVADELFFDPGRATSRAVQEIYEVVELHPPESIEFGIEKPHISRTAE